MNCLHEELAYNSGQKLGIREANSAAAFSNPPEQLDYITYAASGKRDSECFDS